MTDDPTACSNAEQPDGREGEISGDLAGPSPETSPVAPPSTLAEALDRLDVETARRLHAEEALRETEERFRQLSEHAGRFLWMSDPETNELLYVSPGYEEVWARTRENAYRTPEEWVSSFAGRRSRVQSPSHRDQIYQVAGPEGSTRWIRDRLFPIRDKSGQVLRILGIAEDITDAKRMHETMSAHERRMRALYAAVPDMIFRVRKDGVILECKNAPDGSLTLPEDLVGRNLKQLLPSHLVAPVTQHILQALRTDEPQTFTCQYLLPDELRDFEARFARCADDQVIAVVRDITDRKRLEREILEVSSREQQRIGQDLHDSLGQHLTGITFMTKVLERKLARKAPEEAAEASEIGKLVIQALAQTRNLARGLFPAELERNGLVAALRELVSNIERMCGVRCSFCADGSISIQDNVLATHVFRIAQEAISNSVKHGGARNVAVNLTTEGDRIQLSVVDDGTGFSPEKVREGLGLRIMQYRARRIGGAFEVKPAANGGTCVTCIFRKKYESN